MIFRSVLLWLVLVLAGCEKKKTIDPFNVPKNELLAVRLESKYKREIDKDGFSIHYLPRGTDHLIISVRYKPLSNLTMVRQVAGSAREVAIGVAKDDFKLTDLTVDVDIQPAD